MFADISQTKDFRSTQQIFIPLTLAWFQLLREACGCEAVWGCEGVCGYNGVRKCEAVLGCEARQYGGVRPLSVRPSFWGAV